MFSVILLKENDPKVDNLRPNFQIRLDGGNVVKPTLNYGRLGFKGSQLMSAEMKDNIVVKPANRKVFATL